MNDAILFQFVFETKDVLGAESVLCWFVPPKISDNEPLGLYNVKAQFDDGHEIHGTSSKSFEHARESVYEKARNHFAADPKQVRQTDKRFFDSPDTGQGCECSRCGKAIYNIAIRYYPQDGSNSEYRFHAVCLGMNTGTNDFEPEIEDEFYSDDHPYR